MRSTMVVVATAWCAVSGACSGAMSGSDDPMSSDGGGASVRDAMASSDAGGDVDAGVASRDAGGADIDAGLGTDVDAGSGIGTTMGAGCEGRDLLFCDDFESGALDASRWSAIDAREGSSGRVSETHAFEGTHALELDLGTADGARALLSPQGLFPMATNRVYGRFYLYTSPAVDMVHSFLLNATGTLDGGRAYYGLHSNQGRLNSRYVAPAITVHGGLKAIGTHHLPEDTWVCVELLFDGEANEIQFWFDGVEDPDMRVTSDADPPWIAPPFTRIEMGFHTFQAAGAPFSVFYDAVAFDDERIGCGR